MTTFRLISLPAHGALELLAGLLTMVAPFLFGFTAAGAVVAIVIGALVVGLSLATASTEQGSMPIAAHFAFDRGIVIGLLGAGVVVGLGPADGGRAPEPEAERHALAGLRRPRGRDRQRQVPVPEPDRPAGAQAGRLVGLRGHDHALAAQCLLTLGGAQGELGRVRS